MANSPSEPGTRVLVRRASTRACGSRAVSGALKLSRYHVVTPPLRDAETGRPFRVVYSTRTAQRAIVDEDVWRPLALGRLDGLAPTLRDELVELELLVPAGEDELATIVGRNDAAARDSASLRLVVQPTAACQLGCGYCGQEHTADRMSEANQRLVVERARANLATGTYTAIDVGWFGSEPLLGLSVIRSLSPRLQALAAEHGCAYRARVVTNGLLLTPDVARELEHDHGVGQVEITLDGIDATHDERRGWKGGAPSFRRTFVNLVAVARADDVHLRIVVRGNVDRTNADGVDALIDRLAEEGLAGRIAFYTAPVHDWGNDAHSVSFSAPEFARREAGWLAHQVRAGFKPTLVPGRKPIVCLAVERDGELVDAFGNLFSCTEVSYVPAYGVPNRYALGRVDSGTLPGRRQLLGNFNRRIEQRSVPCADCRMLPVCGGACPKAWLDGQEPCPSAKHNITQRLVLELAGCSVPA